MESIHASQVLLEKKVNLSNAKTTAGLNNRPTKKEVRLDLQSEKTSMKNLVIKIWKKTIHTIEKC